MAWLPILVQVKFSEIVEASHVLNVSEGYVPTFVHKVIEHHDAGEFYEL